MDCEQLLRKLIDFFYHQQGTAYILPKFRGQNKVKFTEEEWEKLEKMYHEIVLKEDA